MKSKIDSWLVDGFALRPDEDNPGFFDNVPNHAIGFWGVYATRPLPDKTFLDLYYLGLDRKEATFERGPCFTGALANGLSIKLAFRKQRSRKLA